MIMKGGDLVRWEQPDFPEDNDTGVVIGFFGTDMISPLTEIFWFGEQAEYRYEPGHPHVEVISESR